ncbi:MAG: hypothetical protein K1X66_02530 [Verrucomicrobiae bacterium]|nr:hypothetical protein [Verrucomicrobiae bacterium]
MSELLAPYQTPPKLEILDHTQQPVSDLRVGKMEGAIKNTFLGKKLNPDLDQDRFYVRLQDEALTGKGQVSVKLSTVNASGQNKESNVEVKLKESPPGSGTFISDSLLLVSDRWDDKKRVDKVKDNHLGDRTFQVGLGDRVEVEYPSSNLCAIAQVPVQQQLPIDIVVLRDKPGGNPVISNNKLQEEIKRTQERFAQLGIEIIPNIQVVDPPPKTKLSSGQEINLGNGVQSPTEIQWLDNQLGTPFDSQRLQVFYVSDFNLPTTMAGEKADGIGLKEQGIIVIDAKSDLPYALAHEIGHTLDLGHATNKNVMVDKPSTSQGFGGDKRFTQTQEQQMYNYGTQHGRFSP